MISWMQRHRKYLVVTIWISTIAFVGAGFVGWGAYKLNSNSADTVATVGDRKITVDELQSSYRNLYNYYNQMMGGKLTQEEAEKLHLDQIALNRLIQEALLINYAEEKGITARDEEVLAKITSIDAFHENGKFSKERYFQVLKSIGTNVKTFEKSIKKEIIVQKLMQLLNLPATETDTKMIFASAFMEDKLAAKKVTVDPDAVKIDEAELKKFWEANKEKYLSKKRYLLEAITVSSASIEVSDEDLKSYYEEHKALFRGEDDKILPFEEAKARVKEKVQKKKAKTETLKKYLALKSGKIGAEENLTISEGNTTVPLEKIRAASPGDFIKTIELKEGFMTARLLRTEAPHPLPYEEAKAFAKADLVAQKRRQMLEAKAKEEARALKDLKEIGYVTREDVDKIDFLSKAEASAFLNHLFSVPNKSGYYLLNDSAVVYKVEDQKLFDTDRYAQKKAELQKSVETLKSNNIQDALIKQLQKRYKIEKQLKGQVGS